MKGSHPNLNFVCWFHYFRKGLWIFECEDCRTNVELWLIQKRIPMLTPYFWPRTPYERKHHLPLISRQFGRALSN